MVADDGVVRHVGVAHEEAVAADDRLRTGMRPAMDGNAFADDVVQLVKHLEIDVVNLLHLMLQHLWLHHRIEQHFVGTLDGSQHVHTLHQVRHTHIVMSLCLLFAGFQ